MLSKNKQALQTPIMGKVVLLNKYVNEVKHLPQKDIQYIYVRSLLSLCKTLYTQAFREVRGRDYLKRALDTIIEIQAEAYLIQALGGWTMKVASTLDVMCDEIGEQLYKIASSRNAGVGKSTDETE